MIKIIVFMSNALWTPIMWSHVEWLWWTFKGRLRSVYFHRLLCNAKLNLGKINIHELYFDQLFILFVYFEDLGLLSSSIVQFNSLSTDQCYARDKDDGACFCIDWKTSPIFCMCEFILLALGFIRTVFKLIIRLKLVKIILHIAITHTTGPLWLWLPDIFCDV